MVKEKLSLIKPNPNNPRVFVCLTCGCNFSSNKADKNRTPKYCNKKCYAESLKKYKTCKHCNKVFADFKKKIYCSVGCRNESRIGIKFSKKWRTALSEGRKKSDKCKGKNLYNWKGGKETERIRIKQSFYKRKKNLKLEMPLEYLKNVLIAQNNKCFFCEKDLTDYKAIEHLTPVSKGGDNQKYNLVYSCKSCNSKKRQNTLEDFAIKKNRFDWLNKFDIIYATSIN